ncbi:MAG: SIMPL domain-containing protein [Thiohalomonadaceae bacterium]
MKGYARLALLTGMLLAGATALAQQAEVSRISVSGRGEVTALPDSARLSFAAVARHENAAEAQAQVNRVMTRAMDAVRKLGVDPEALSTTGISLSPVYPDPRTEAGRQGRIVAYHASNQLEVRLDGTALLGKVIDAAVGAGANAVEGVTLTLSDDSQERQEALRRAVIDARAKAEAIAAAMGVRLDSVEQVAEQGVGVYTPTLARAMVAEAATPVATGQVRVEANVHVVYRIAQGL